MDPYTAWLRDVLRLAGEIYFRRVEAELRKFSEALEEWMHALLMHPRPDWRNSLDLLLAQQAAEGRGVDSKSREALIDHLEVWEATVDWSAIDGGVQRRDRAIAADDAADASDADKPAPLPKNWPALTPAEAEAAQRTTGLPWWYPIQPGNRTDSLWRMKLVSVGQVARDRLLTFYREVAVLGQLSRAVEDPEQFDVDSLLAQKQRIQKAFDGYVRAKRDVYYEWTRYLSMEWFIGPEVEKLFRKIDNALPDWVDGFTSPHKDALKAMRRASFAATRKKMRRTEAAYRALIWTDNVIAVIEIVTLVGSAKAVFTQAAKKMAAKGLSKAAARSAAVAYAVAHLGTAAASAAVVGGVIPRVLSAAGLDEADVRAGLVVFRAFFTIVGLRAVVKSSRPGRSPAGRTHALPKSGPRPGSVSGNPANRLIETGVPTKSGGWARRWIRMNETDYRRWLRERFEFYNHVSTLARRMRLSPTESRRFKFEQMRRWRTEWLRTFLENRDY